MSEKYFTKPERPFLLLTEDVDGNISYHWLETETELMEVINECQEYGNKIIDALEIGSSRDIEIPPIYLVDDFIKEINDAYETAKGKGFDSIVLVIDTNMDKTYYINDTENGFQCDEFDFYFDDLDSMAAALFEEEMIGKPVEIRIE
jgi:hypothetical protein